MDPILEAIDNTPEGATPDLSAFDDAALTAAADAIREAGRAYVNGEDPTAEDIEAARRLADALTIVTGELAGRQEAGEARRTDAATLAAQFDTPNEETPAEEPAAETPAEEPAATPPVQASVRDIVRNRPAANTPTPEDQPRRRVMQAAVGDGDRTGGDIATISDLGTALIRRHRNLSPGEQAEVRSSVARTSWSEQNALQAGMGEQDAGETILQMQHRWQAEARQRLDQIIAGRPAALQAATGICGPAEPYYDQYTVIGSDGQIGVPTLGARRGKVTVPDSLSFLDFDGENGVAFPYTSDDGAAGSKQKECLTIVCDTPASFEVIAYSTCLTYSNFMGQFYGERVAAAGLTSLAAHTHRVNGQLFDDVVAIAVADGTSYGTADNNGGAIVQLGSNLVFHAALLRSKYRMPLGAVVDVQLPHWVLDALFADALARDSTSSFSGIAAQFVSFCAERGVNINWVHDWQALASISPGYFPTTVDALMWPAGSVVRLTGETLDLGVVRDSTLNAGNEFQTFVETFDGIAKIGHEITLIDGITICPTGSTGARETIACATGS